MKLLSTFDNSRIKLNNHVVMAPMTRSRALGGVPTQSMVTYYMQRANAGLIITEGVAPSANGLGYARIPGIFTDAQIEGWKKVTDAVHAKGGKIFIQLMHCGRVSHTLNMSEGSRVLAPSALTLEGEMWTDSEGMKGYSAPEEMSVEDIKMTVNEYIQAAKNAIKAGFDGVEIHAANGYLIEQFLAPNTNLRTDSYGGSEENRMRFLMEVIQGTVAAIGADKVGARISPRGVFNGIHPYSDEMATKIASFLHDQNLVYLHLVNHAAMGAPEVPAELIQTIRNTFTNTLILSGGYDASRAESDLQSGLADLIAYGRPYIANPDLVQRITIGAEWAMPNFDLLYTPGDEGYIDYPTLQTV